MLEEAHRVLRPGGILILEFTQMAPSTTTPHDYFRFTRYGAAWLLDRAGFEPVEMRSRSAACGRASGCRTIAALNRVNRGPDPRDHRDPGAVALRGRFRSRSSCSTGCSSIPREVLAHLVVARRARLDSVRAAHGPACPEPVLAFPPCRIARPSTGRPPDCRSWPTTRPASTATRPFLLRSTTATWKRLLVRGGRARDARVRARCSRAGRAPGDRVGLQSENRPEWGLAYLGDPRGRRGGGAARRAAQGAGGGRDPRHRGARLCVVSAQAAAGARRACAPRGCPTLELVALDAARAMTPSLRPTRSARFAGAPRRPSRRREPRDLAVLIFTSGTTGQAKGVMLSHSNLLYNVEAVARTFEFGPGDRCCRCCRSITRSSPPAASCARCAWARACAHARGLNSKELREDMPQLAAPPSSRRAAALREAADRDRARHRRGAAAAPAAGANAAVGVTRSCASRPARGSAGALLRPLRESAGTRAASACSCAAPRRFATEVFWGFIDLGWPMLEGYGLTETSPVVCREPSRPAAPGRGRLADRGRRGAHRGARRRGQRRDRGARPERDAGLLRQRRPPPPRCCATAGSTPATSGACCRTAACRSPGGSRT